MSRKNLPKLDPRAAQVAALHQEDEALSSEQKRLQAVRRLADQREPEIVGRRWAIRQELQRLLEPSAAAAGSEARHG